MQSSVDHASTILGFAGLGAPESMQGYDFSPLIRGKADAKPPRNAVLIEHLFIQTQYKAPHNSGEVGRLFNEDTIKNNKSYRCRGVVTKQWKYFVYYEHTPKIEEFYDLENDPLEQANLADDPAHQATLKKLRIQCQAMYDEIASQP